MSLDHAIPIYGLHYHKRKPVPLLRVHAEATIKELGAQVKLIQTYSNDSWFPIEATYSFPIPARATVCSFVMIKQDGTRVVGSVLEKQDAWEAYVTAVAQRKQASLMEQHSPDVFQLAVGNIPSNHEVQIELVYATELSEDEETDSIRFHLPVHIGARYGRPISSFFWPSSFFSSTPFLTLSMSVETIAPISKIGCPSHPILIKLGPDPNLPNFKDLPFSNYARVSLSSDSPLDKDFVLTVKSAGLDAPRCVAELHPTDNTVALGLSLVPRFKLPDLSCQEFVFMVDRSGSMKGMRIEAAKKALVIMLRALPHANSLFQIVSFGSRISSLWPEGSQPYNQATLEEATRHIDTMMANYSGTEIRTALQHVFVKQRLDRPMNVLMLTDGDAWDLNGVLSEVKLAVSLAPKNAYVRVSVLGVGNSASTAMCEGIARVGNGTCMMVGEDESTFTGKIARMLKAAKTPPIADLTIDWGLCGAKESTDAPPECDDFEIVEAVSEKTNKTLDLCDESPETNTMLPPPPPEVVLPLISRIQQAPFQIQNLFPNIRLNAYAILQGNTIPKTVVIRGSTADGAEIELPISVVLSRLENAPGVPSAIHALAARKIIQDLEDGKHALTKTISNPDDKDLLARTVKEGIIRLGKTYSIASAHTSFVAVDGSQPGARQLSFHNVPSGFGMGEQAFLASPGTVSAKVDPIRAPIALSVGGSAASSSGLGNAAFGLMSNTMAAVGKSIWSGTASLTAGDVSLMNAAPLVGNNSRRPRRGYRRSKQSSKDHLRHESSAVEPVVGSTMVSDPYSGGASVDGLPVPAAPPASYAATTSQSANLEQQLACLSLLESGLRKEDVRAAVSPLLSAPVVLSSDPLESLARMQFFDGCFSLEVLRVITLKTDIEVVRSAFPVGATDGIVATVLAMVFLSTKLGAGVEPESWEGIYEKAQQYVADALQKLGATKTVEALEAEITHFLV
ncbi:von Willebrand factor type A domain-containing protein [Mycena sanguinolenta]|nr:von Willebrand factor type A domain-containing protein [Mycena sanguinolenta]